MNIDIYKFINDKVAELSKGQFYGYTIPPKNHCNLPRKIYFYWDKGIDQAPEIVKACHESWVFHNKSWEIIILDETKAENILGYKKEDSKLPAHYADELRTELLFLHGGVWIDSTVYCSTPLDSWIQNIFNQTDFFCFYRPGKDRIISNWFIASTRGGKLISAWHDLYFKYISNCIIERPYFSHHWVFEYLLRTSPEHSQEFESMPKISAEPVHFLQEVLKNDKISSAALSRLKAVPLHKLSYKFPDKINLEKLNYFIKNIDRQ